MKASGFEKITRDTFRTCGNLPFGFSRKANPGPVRVGICFVVADVADWFVKGEWLYARCRICLPISPLFFPIERRVPALSVNDVPTVRKPQFRTGVTTVFDEFQVLSVGNGTRCNA